MKVVFKAFDFPRLETELESTVTEIDAQTIRSSLHNYVKKRL